MNSIKNLFTLAMLMVGISAFADVKIQVNPNVLTPGEQGTISVILDNTVAVKNFQTTVVLPEGIKPILDDGDVDYTQVGRISKTSNWNTSVTTTKSGNIQVLVFSPKGKLIEAGNEAIMEIEVEATEDYTGEPISTNETVLDAADGEELGEITEAPAELPLEVYPSLVGDEDIELNSHMAASVKMASSLKVQFENGAKVIGLTYLINEMNMGQDEEGTFWTVGKEIAAGEANLNTIAYAEFDDMLYFEQGKKYQLTVTAFENPADPTEIGTYTYEFNGAYVEPVVANIVITEAGYATYYAPFCVDLNFVRANIEAYIVTGIDENNKLELTLIEDGIIPAFQPVLLKGDACIIPMSGEEEFYIAPKGILEGVEEDGPAVIGNYVLQSQNGVVGFYQVTEEVQPTVKAYHATLVVPNDNAKIKAYLFNDEATAISNVASSNNEVIFDLQGRKVANAQKGIFVVNGKKVIK